MSATLAETPPQGGMFRAIPLVAPAGLTHLSDEQLFQRYTDGDEHGFQLLMERYEPRIQGFLRKRLSDEERVEDLTQDTFLRIHRARSRNETSLPG